MTFAEVILRRTKPASLPTDKQPHTLPEEDDAERTRLEWVLGDYVDAPCPRCGRWRLCECANGKHRCEKCDWSPELNAYVPVMYDYF